VVARTRSSPIQSVSGPRWFNNNYPGSITGAGSITTGSHTCGDQTGSGDCAPFSVHKHYSSGGIINKFSTGAFSSQFRDYLCDWLRNTANGGHLNVEGTPSDLSAANSAAARSNPSRPYVDVPVNILDIKARPKQIMDDILDMRRRGFWRRPPRPSPRELARGGGSAWLQYNFMIAPIVGDIVKLARGADQVSRRVDEINRLHHGHGIRRTLPVFAGSAHQQISQTVQSVGTVISRTFDVETLLLKRVHCRWKPERPGLEPAPRQVREWANRSVYGLTVDLSTLWELTPWSWLADWFGDVGTYLKASRNIIPAVLTDCCPMTHLRTTWSCGGGQLSAETSITPIRKVREQKSRIRTSLAPVAHLNFLNGHQMGILASIAATRS